MVCSTCLIPPALMLSNACAVTLAKQTWRVRLCVSMSANSSSFIMNYRIPHALTHAHMQTTGEVNVILSLGQIPLSNPGLWTFGRSSRSGLELRAVLEGFFGADRQEASHKLR